jgi:hypothetical protein
MPETFVHMKIVKYELIIYLSFPMPSRSLKRALIVFEKYALGLRV